MGFTFSLHHDSQLKLTYGMGTSVEGGGGSLILIRTSDIVIMLRGLIQINNWDYLGARRLR